MGAFLDKPKTEKYNESKSGAGLRYGLSSMQGWRMEMEDAHSAVIGIPEVGNHISWFAVFDGHAGARISAHCSAHLLDCISSNDDFKEALKKERTLSQDELMDKVQGGILAGFLELDEKLRKIPEVANGEDKSGTTAVCALITEKYVIFSNCGDSRGVLSGSVGSGSSSVPVLATQDHKPSNPPERERIENAGGNVMIQRVNGFLAVSRALGDFEYKDVDGKGPTEQLVSPEPEFYIKARDSEKDEFLVLACDGVWDVMSNEEICTYIAARMRVSNDLEAIANEVIDTCFYKGSRDNMSIIIIAFPAAPKVDPEAKRKDDELNKLLQQRVEEIVAENEGNVEFSAVFQKMTEEKFPDLPPGGGLSSKQLLIEEAFSKVCPGKPSNAADGSGPSPVAMLLYANASKLAAAAAAAATSTTTTPSSSSSSAATATAGSPDGSSSSSSTSKSDSSSMASPPTTESSS